MPLCWLITLLIAATTGTPAMALQQTDANSAYQPRRFKAPENIQRHTPDRQPNTQRSITSGRSKVRFAGSPDDSHDFARHEPSTGEIAVPSNPLRPATENFRPASADSRAQSDHDSKSSNAEMISAEDILRPSRGTRKLRSARTILQASAIQSSDNETDATEWQRRRHATTDASPFPMRLSSPNNQSASQPIDDPFGDHGERSVLRNGRRARNATYQARRFQDEDEDDADDGEEIDLGPASRDGEDADGDDASGMDDDPMDGDAEDEYDQMEEDLKNDRDSDRDEDEDRDARSRDELPEKRNTDRRFDTNCDDVAAEVATRSLSLISLDQRPALKADNQIPFECTMAQVGNPIRAWNCQTYTFTASALCHKPLYFEDIQLERYGHTSGPLTQPFRSAAHFFTRYALLPYKMGIHPPNECVYALGYYRPGECAPWLRDPFPISERGFLYEAGFAVGAAYVIP